MRIRHTVTALLVVAVVVVTTAGAGAGPTNDPPTAARYGAGWLARQVNAQGFVPGDNGPNLSITVDTGLALAAAGVGGDAFDRIVGYLEANFESYVADAGTDRPGALANLVMLAVAAGRSPTAFGGSAPANDLVARLLATRRTTGSDAGLFGAQDPTFDGAFRQGLALAALAAAGRTDAAAAADAVAWLRAQQCSGGGWQAYRADTTAPCEPTDLENFTGPDSNSTALAVQGLRSHSATFTGGDPLDYLHGVMNDDGGFGFLDGLPTDANSTAVVVQAIIAGGEDPAAGRWDSGDGNPYRALLSFQLGCEAPAAERGAFTFFDEANAFATVQAVPAAAGRPLPLAAATVAQGEPVVPCDPATTTTTTAPTTTTTTTTTTTPATTTSTTAPAPAVASLPSTPVATPVRATPRFVG